MHKGILLFDLNFVQHYVFTNSVSSAILCLQGEGNKKNLIDLIPKKNLKKTLDKLLIPWYNTYRTERERRQAKMPRDWMM